MLSIPQLIQKLIQVQDDLSCEAKKNAFAIKEIAEVIATLEKMLAAVRVALVIN